MRIRLLKSWTNQTGRKYPIGQILQVYPTLGRELIMAGKAEEYSGEYPPKTKTKTNFFKPK